MGKKGDKQFAKKKTVLKKIVANVRPPLALCGLRSLRLVGCLSDLVEPGTGDGSVASKQQQENEMLTLCLLRSSRGLR